MQRPLLHRIRRATALLCALPLVGGCFTYETTVRLSPDGSGSVEREFVFTGEMASMLRSVSAAGELDPDPCAAQALGEGVRLVSTRPIDEEERFGCSQVYAFTDINTLRLSPSPDASFTVAMDAADGVLEEPITFRFAPATATLVVRMPPTEAEGPVHQQLDEPEHEEEAGRAMALAMMREMLSGSRFAIHLVLPGTILETDATHAEGNRVTLVEIDFDALLEDPESLGRFLDVGNPSSEEAKAMLAATPGVRFETRDEVTIRFR